MSISNGKYDDYSVDHSSPQYIGSKPSSLNKKLDTHLLTTDIKPIDIEEISQQIFKEREMDTNKSSLNDHKIKMEDPDLTSKIGTDALGTTFQVVEEKDIEVKNEEFQEIDEKSKEELEDDFFTNFGDLDIAIETESKLADIEASQAVAAEEQGINEINEGEIEKQAKIKEKIEGKVKEEEGKVIKEEGKVIKEEGKFIEEEGKVIEEEGKVIEEEGKFIEMQGKVLEEEGKVIKEERKVIKEEGLTNNEIFAKKISMMGEEFKEDGMLPIAFKLALSGKISRVSPEEVAEGKTKDFVYIRQNNGELKIPEHLADTIKLKVGDTFEGITINSIKILSKEEQRAFTFAYILYAKNCGLILQQPNRKVQQDQTQTSTLLRESNAPISIHNHSVEKKTAQKQVSPKTKIRAGGVSEIQKKIEANEKARVQEFKRKVARAIEKLNLYLDDEERKEESLKYNNHSFNISEENVDFELLKLEQRFQDRKKNGFPLSVIKQTFQIIHKEAKQVLKDSKELNESSTRYVLHLDEVFTKIEKHNVNISGTNANIGNIGINAEFPSA